MDKTILNFALIGCGRIVRKHLDAIDKIDNAKLVAVCDLDMEKARKVGKSLKIPYYTNYKEMLEKENSIDVVSVLTDTGSHAKISIDVADFKKHVLVEKPMALRLKDADKMIEACDKNRVKLFVVKQNRFNKAVQKTKKTLSEGRFGKLVLGTIRVRWCRHQRYYDQDKWRGTWWGDGGVMTNQASHHIDLLEWFLGDVESVMCMTKTQLVDIEAEDTAVAILKFESGALGIIEATTATRPKDLEGSLSILGENGNAVIGGFAVNQITEWNFEDENTEDKKVIEEFKELPPNVYGYGHVAQIKDVIDAIINDKRGLIDGSVGRKSLELINALYESAETGKKVYLRFHPEKCKLGNVK